MKTRAREAIAKYEALKPSRFQFLQSMRLEREVSAKGASDYYLEIVLVSIEPRVAGRLVLTFRDVRDLRIGSLDGMFGLFFEVRSIEGNQLEGLSFKVNETENATFSFVCGEFSADIRDQ